MIYIHSVGARAANRGVDGARGHDETGGDRVFPSPPPIPESPGIVGRRVYTCPTRVGGSTTAVGPGELRVKARRRTALPPPVARDAYHSLGPPTTATSLQLVRVVRTGEMAGPRVTRSSVMYYCCCVAFAVTVATASRADGIVYEKIPLGEYTHPLTRVSLPILNIVET